MIVFILNDTLVETDSPPGMPLLDFIRNERGLKGTKSGCREGECGACTVLCGEPDDEQGKDARSCVSTFRYKTIVSCLTPLGNVRNCHIFTIEGLNGLQLSPVQEAFISHSATQCGFCTPGFILSVTGFLISGDFSDPGNMVTALDGNICRCTGYASIIRAAGQVIQGIPEEGRNNIPWLVSHQYLPEYFLSIPVKLSDSRQSLQSHSSGKILVAGGTDLMVQKADLLSETEAEYIHHARDMRTISVSGDLCMVGGAVTMSQLRENRDLKEKFPAMSGIFPLIASTQVRNMATVAGNLVNASPIGDLSICFLALDSTMLLMGTGETERSVPLREFFTGYKTLAMKQGELIRAVQFRLPGENEHFHFEKVSKRTHLDIASVNSAILLTFRGNRIENAAVSAGGVAPVPLFLAGTSAFLAGKELTQETMAGVLKIMQEEIKPISDVRGSANYKRLLLRQLILAHFDGLFPGLIGESFVHLIKREDEEC